MRDMGARNGSECAGPGSKPAAVMVFVFGLDDDDVDHPSNAGQRVAGGEKTLEPGLHSGLRQRRPHRPVARYRVEGL